MQDQNRVQQKRKPRKANRRAPALSFAIGIFLLGCGGGDDQPNNTEPFATPLVVANASSVGNGSCQV
jgi:hypothetical protein